MKRIMAASLAVAASLVFAVTSFAKEGDKSVEGTLNYGTEAFNDLGGQYGVTLGFGYEWRNRLQPRVDLSYFRTSTTQMGMDVTGSRYPLDLGARYLFPLKKIDPDLTAYGQGGLEISFDEWHPAAGMGLTSRTSVGLLIGGGAEYALSPEFGAVANLQYHVIQDGFLSLGIGMAYHFR